MCGSGHCFTDEEKKKLEEKGWSKDQIEFTEGSIIEDNIKELIGGE